MAGEELCGLSLVSEMAAAFVSVWSELQQRAELTPAPIDCSHVKPTTSAHLRRYDSVCRP